MSKKQLSLSKRNISLIISSLILVFICYIFYSSSSISLPFSQTLNNNISSDNSNNNSNGNTDNSTEASSKYSGITITLDAGHGGFDPGKVTDDGVKEKDINLQIALFLKQELEDMGFTLYMTRASDISLDTEGASSRKNSDLNNRVKIVSEHDSDLLISIHQNSFSQGSVHGAQVFYYGNSEEGKLLAGFIQSAIKEQVDTENTRDIKGNTEYLILAKSPCTSVIVECGFISNPDECEKLLSYEYQHQLAHAIASAVAEYFDETE